MRKVLNWLSQRLQREEVEKYVRVEFGHESREVQDYLIRQIRMTGTL